MKYKLRKRYVGYPPKNNYENSSGYREVEFDLGNNEKIILIQDNLGFSATIFTLEKMK